MKEERGVKFGAKLIKFKWRVDKSFSRPLADISAVIYALGPNQAGEGLFSSKSEPSN